MKRYMLDTNAINHAVRLEPTFMANMKKVPISSLCISSITYAEIHYGLKKKPEAIRLHRTVKELLRYIEVLPFDEETAEIYGEFRASIEKHGKNLAANDMLIAAHAYAENAILVTNDQAFSKIPDFKTVDWTKK